jgi:hypothetical protein
MYPAQPSELLRSALRLLPKLPCTIDVISSEGGSFLLTLAATEGNLVYGYGDRELVKNDLELEARLRDDQAGGWDIRFVIVRSYFQSGSDLMLHLNVLSVEQRFADRLAPRARVAELASARVLYAKRHDRDEYFDVRLADVSPTGVAFITERRLDVGDLVEVSSIIDGRPIRFEVRVVRMLPALYGRNRVGCEITTILEADRQTLLRTAERGEHDDSAAQRNPEIAERLEAARRQQGLGARRAPRYDV